MTRTGRTSRLAAALLASLLFVAAACGTDGSDDASTKADETTTTSEVPATTTTEAPADQGHDHGDDPDPAEPAVEEPSDPNVGVDFLDKDAAEEAVAYVNLSIDDLPADDGWESVPDDGSDNSVFDQCAGDALDLDQHTTAKARGEELTKELDGNAELMIQTATGYLDDLDPASEMIEILTDDEFIDCSGQGVIDSADDPDLEITGAFQHADGLPQLGDDAGALQGDFTVTHTPSGQSAHLSALVILVRTDSMVTAVTATAVDTPGDEQLLYGLLDTIAERQAETLATA